MSKSAITFQLGLTTNSIGLFYKYALYKIRLVTKQDLMHNASNILPVPSPDDKNVSVILHFYKFDFFFFISISCDRYGGLMHFMN